MKRTRKVIGCALAVGALAPLVAQAAPITDPVPLGEPGTFGGSTYQVYSKPGITWEEARDYIQNNLNDGPQSCYLATMPTLGEDNFVEEVRANSGVLPAETWVGGFQPPGTTDPKADWEWVNMDGPIPGTNPMMPGDPFANWQEDEPNDAGDERFMGIGLGGEPGWNDEQNTNNIGGFIVECDVVSPGNDVVIFAPDEDLPVVSVAEEVVAAGRIEQISCVIKEPRFRKPWQHLDLIKRVKQTHTPDCMILAQKFNERPDYRGELQAYQRAFRNPLSPDHNKKDIVVTLVQSTDLDGNPADLTKGVVLFEGTPEIFNVFEQNCRNTATSAVDARLSPSAARVAVDGNQFIDRFATNSTIFCNRGRQAGRKSDQLFVYPIRTSFAYINARQQVRTEAFDFRAKLAAFRTQCEDTAFIDTIRQRLNIAVRRITRGGPVQRLDGIERLEDLSRLLLDTSAGVTSFSYDGCPIATEGETLSRTLALTHKSWRDVLFPDDGDAPYVVPADILADLPPFPGDTPPTP